MSDWSSDVCSSDLLAPRAASFIDTASPMPVPPPVTIAVLPCRFIVKALPPICSSKCVGRLDPAETIKFGDDLDALLGRQKSSRRQGREELPLLHYFKRPKEIYPHEEKTIGYLYN